MQNKQLKVEGKSLNTGLYRHYKGGMYRVIDLVRHSETEETLVLYKPLYDPQTHQACDNQSLWVRPAYMFFESVTVDGNNRMRFEYLAEQSLIAE
ncbi:DUF1653 domain-containing protein [Ningiella sp. W23]|uniref:DUF1653 domain-containing protein n=1 Tax=Ningiella sp. W23 TaxID=3023715 RepID=UPI0037571820